MLDEGVSSAPGGPGFYHVCFAVPDLDEAMAELTAIAGVTFGEPISSQLGPWPYSLVVQQADFLERWAGGR